MTDIKPDLVITDLPSPTPSDPLEALSWLGDTVEEVAEGLRARGIKGTRTSIYSCPLAGYLRLWWDGAWIGGMDGWTGTGKLFDTPSHLSNFISAFDKGRFPDLIADNG